MLKLTWKLNGRTVAPSQLRRELTNSIESAALDQARNDVSRIRCPVHGTLPRNVRVTRVASRLRFTFDPCCERQQEAINSAMR